LSKPGKNTKKPTINERGPYSGGGKKSSKDKVHEKKEGEVTELTAIESKRHSEG